MYNFGGSINILRQEYPVFLVGEIPDDLNEEVFVDFSRVQSQDGDDSQIQIKADQAYKCNFVNFFDMDGGQSPNARMLDAFNPVFHLEIQVQPDLECLARDLYEFEQYPRRRGVNLGLCAWVIAFIDGEMVIRMQTFREFLQEQIDNMLLINESLLV